MTTHHSQIFATESNTEGGEPLSPLPKSRLLAFSPWWLVSFIWSYFSYTQCQGLMWFDSGELALAGHSWGLGHPPGQAFYALLSALTSFCPSPLWALNHISVLASALTILPLLSLRIHLITALNKGLSRESNCLGGKLSPSELIIGGGWAFLYPVWDQATRIEVYALGNLLGFSALSLLVSSLRRDQSYFGYAGVVLGLCGATQAMFAVHFGFVSIALLWGVGSASLKNRDWRVLFRYAGGVIGGFGLPHLYMLVTLLYSKGFVWGTWSSWTDVTRYFGGRDYIQNIHSWSFVIDHLIRYVAWLSSYGGTLWILFTTVAIIGLRNGKLFLLFLLISCVGIFPLTYELYWPEVPDFSGYLLPFFSCSLLLIWTLWERLEKTLTKIMGRLILGYLILSMFTGEWPPNERSRSLHTLPIDMAKNWLDRLPPEATLFVESDHWVFPLMYIQTVIGYRSDVLVFNTGFARSTWYWEWVLAQHEDLPNFEQFERQRGHSSRLNALSYLRGPTYTENEGLARVLSPNAPIISTPPCPSAWGYSVSCQSQLPLPTVSLLLQWTKVSAHQDPISTRVLARLGHHLLKSAWYAQDTKRAIALARAALGETTSAAMKPPQWWPVPSSVWRAAQVGLIGDPSTLQTLITSLKGEK